MKELNFKNTTSIKRHLVKLGTKEECSICGLGVVWNNKPIVLQLDHIDGNNSNNRVDNLRLVCPNCHSQTRTYAGRNISKHERNKRPTREELITLYMQNSIREISLIKGVSVRSVYQWIEHYNLKPFKDRRVFSCTQIRSIRKSYKGGETQRALATKFGVTKGSIQKIVENKSYVDC